MKRKSKNAFARYFENFGLKQLSEIAIVLGMLSLIVVLFLTENISAYVIVMIIGCALLSLGFVLGLIRHLVVVCNKNINHRSPEYKNAIASLIASSVGTVLAVVGLILAIIEL